MNRAAVSATLMLGGIACAAALSACRSTAPERPLPAGEESRIVFENIAVFPGTGHDLLREQTVVIEGGRIAWTGPSNEAPSAQGDQVQRGQVIDGNTLTLMPGFVDAHTHVLNTGGPVWAKIDADPRGNLEAFLSAGITTVIDLGGRTSEIQDLIDQMNTGRFEGPRTYFTGLPGTAPDGHPLQLLEAEFGSFANFFIKLIYPQLADVDDARTYVDEIVAHDAHAVKLMFDAFIPGGPQLEPEVLRAAIDAAHGHGRKVFVHIGSADDALGACRAGADVLAHGPARGPLAPEQASELAERGCRVTMTITVPRVIDALATRSWTPSELDRRWGLPAQLKALAKPAPPRAELPPALVELADETARHRDHWARTARTLYEQNVELLIGTDAPLPGNLAGSSFHHELQQLAEVGIPPVELLVAATSRGAGLIEDEPDFGTVEVGKLADLVVVEGDPTVDIARAANVRYVLRAGRLVRSPSR